MHKWQQLHSIYYYYVYLHLYGSRSPAHPSFTLVWKKSEPEKSVTYSMLRPNTVYSPPSEPFTRDIIVLCGRYRDTFLLEHGCNRNPNVQNHFNCESSNFETNRARAWKRCFREFNEIFDRRRSRRQTSIFLVASSIHIVFMRKCCCYCLPSLRPDPDVIYKISSAAYFVCFGYFGRAQNCLNNFFLCERVLKTLP